jgi:hypothetical protein
MTTIAWDGKVLASDARWCDGDVQVISRTKIQRLPSGALYGGAGSSDDRELLAMLAKVKRGDALPSLAQLGTIRQNLRAILVLPNRRVYVLDTCNTSPGEPDAEECGCTEYDSPCAVGSGAALALAAMKAQILKGHKPDAFEAVKIACDLDPQSKGPVYRLTLHPQNNQPRE